jgi:hypothetical protein
MKSLLLRYATPLITGLFLVSLVSGIALFFHIGNGTFNEMHEWLSMVLILPFVLHIWKNWRPLVTYLSRPPMAIALIVSLAAALGFVYQSTQQKAGGPPQFAIVSKMITGSPAAVAPVLGETPDTMVARLKAAGFTAAAPELALTDIAKQSGKTDRDVVPLLLAPSN